MHKTWMILLGMAMCAGCQSPIADTTRCVCTASRNNVLAEQMAKEQREAVNGKAPPVDGAIATGSAEFNKKYDSIQYGVLRERVVAILGREPDWETGLGGTLGDRRGSWFEEKATISVTFDCSSGRVVAKEIRQTDRKEGW